MKEKAFWMKLIVFVVIFMEVIAEVLPTSCMSVVYASESMKYEDAAWTDLVYPRRKTRFSIF